MSLRRLLVALLLTAASSLATAASASAGTYDVYGCRTPDGRAVAISGWAADGTAYAVPHNTCATGGDFGTAIVNGPALNEAFGQWSFEAPAGTTIANYTLHRFIHSVSGMVDGTPWTKGGALYRDAAALNDQHREEMCFAWSYCTALGDPHDPLGVVSAVSSSGLAARRLIAAVHCLGPCPATASTGAYDIYEARVGLSDPAPPVFLRNPSGSLFSKSEVSGIRSVSFTATDDGGGLYRVGVMLDGVTYESRPVDPGAATCVRPATTPVPCPRASSPIYTVDTAGLPDGRHDIQLAVSDIAGNTTYSQPCTVTIRNHAKPNGVNAGRDVRLSTRFKGHGRYRVVRYGARPSIIGKLLRSDGRPITGANLLVLGRAKRPGSAFRTLGIPTTDRKGRFHFKLPKGPSRHIRVAYRAFDLDATASAQRDIGLDVHAGVRLSIHPRAVANGHRIVFRGRLLGGPGRKGTLVTMQETTPRPLTFMTLHANRHGRFHATYRFRYTYRPSRFRFRALVQHQAGYPYIRGRSPSLSVRVSP